MSVSFQTNPSFLDVLLLHDLAGGTLVPCSALPETTETEKILVRVQGGRFLFFFQSLLGGNNRFGEANSHQLPLKEGGISSVADRWKPLDLLLLTMYYSQNIARHHNIKRRG